MNPPILYSVHIVQRTSCTSTYSVHCFYCLVWRVLSKSYSGLFANLSVGETSIIVQWQIVPQQIVMNERSQPKWILYRWPLLTTVFRKICPRNYYLFSVSNCCSSRVWTLCHLSLGALLSVFLDMIQMHIRSLDHFMPDHTLFVKLLDLELVLFLRLAASKTASHNYFML